MRVRSLLTAQVAYLAAFATSAVLALERLGVFSAGVPGCSTAGGCGALLKGPWGHVPGLALPWSYVGVTWFAALAATALAHGRAAAPTPALLWLARLGAFGSLAFLALMAWLLSLCPWCLATHVAGVVGWWAIDDAARAATTSTARLRFAPLVGLGAAALAIALLAWGEARRLDADALARQAEEDRVTALARAKLRVEADEAAARARGAVTPPPVDAVPSLAARLVGRRTLGMKDAPVRLVVFSDYQCPDCGKIEKQIEMVMTRGDIELTPKHFPLCAECNVGTPTSPHPDACRRAWLAEAAGVLGGAAAFDQAHRALFALHEAPGDPVAAVSAATGIDSTVLQQASARPEVIEAVKSDVQDAIALGVTYTPMIFVNGIEWKWYAGNGGSLAALVDRLAKEAPAAPGPPPAPPDATDKLVDDWRRAPSLPALVNIKDSGHFAIDGGAAATEVILWLDYRLPGARIVQQALADLSAEGVALRVRILQYPVSEQCNPGSGAKGGDGRACICAAAAIAAANVGGAPAFRAMHAWLLQNAATTDSATIMDEAARQGLAHDAFQAQFATGAALQTVREEADLLNHMMRIQSLPTVVIGGKMVPRWSHPGASTKEILKRIIDATAAKPTSAPTSP